MAISSIPSYPDNTRRVVLVDFDWDDADLVPELLSHRGLSVRLVAGADAEDPGVRLAELCGLPRTLDLADLTREIFDLALVSGRSPRRGQVEGLLLALGTPSFTPQEFIADRDAPAETAPVAETALQIQAAVLEAALDIQTIEAFVDLALTELPTHNSTAPATPETGSPETSATPTEPASEPAPIRIEGFGDRPLPSPSPATRLGTVPDLEDRVGIEAVLLRLMTETDTARAEVHIAGPGPLALAVEAGPADPLLAGLVGRAESLDSPQVVAAACGPAAGVAWGAWPFRTAGRRGVIAAAGVATGRWTVWASAAGEMIEAWSRRELEQSAPAFPMVPTPQAGWLEPADFWLRLELAVERHRRDGLRFALHRLDFPISAVAVDLFARRLPGHLRDTDTICRPSAQRVLLLTAAPQARFPYLRGRLAALWQEAWAETGNERPIPGMADERREMTSPEDVESFLAQARVWLGPEAV